MDPLSLLNAILETVAPLRGVCDNAKANKQQCRTLTERIQLLIPPLQELELKLNPKADGKKAVEYQQEESQIALLTQLQALFTVILHARDLLDSFSAANWLKKLRKRSDYSDEFRSINGQLMRAQSDLGFGLQAMDAFSQERDMEDIKADMAEINGMAEAILEEIRRNEKNEEEKYEFIRNWSGMHDENMKRMVEQQARMSRWMKEQQQQRQRQIAPLFPLSLSLTQSLPPVTVTPLSMNSQSPSDSIQFMLPRIDPSDLQLGSLIGSGRLGEVYQAAWLSRDQTVAVKKFKVQTMDQAAVNAFYQETKAFFALPNHCHVITLFGICVDESRDIYWMVMEWMEQGSLYHYLTRSQTSCNVFFSTPLMSMLGSIDRMAQCARAVSHLHCIPTSHGPVVHRDIKSLNFLVDRHGTVKLSAFGLSKVRLASTVMSTMGDGGVGGSVRWMAPELLDASSQPTTASDIYALGMVFYEILAREVPWPHDRDECIIAMVMQGNRPKLPEKDGDDDDVPADLRALIQSCWHEEASERPNALQLIAALRAIRLQMIKRGLSSRAFSLTPTVSVPPIRLSRSTLPMRRQWIPNRAAVVRLLLAVVVVVAAAAAAPVDGS